MSGRRTAPIVALAGIAIMLAALTGCAQSGVKAAPGGAKVETHKTAVPAPSAGTATQTVAPVDPGATTKVALDGTAKLPTGITISLGKVYSTHVSATTPGEIAGPAVVAVVHITNNTASTIDLGSTVVTLTDSDGNPGQGTTAGPASPFTATVGSGASLNGTYVFGVPKSGINPIQISVSYAGGAPVALFAGNVS
jgi:hypothetical protein